MEGGEDNEMKQKLQELQKQLGKKQLFEGAVSKISSLLTLYYASASPSLSNLFYTVVCRVATILKARYTAKGFWTSGLHLFLEAEKLVAEPSQKDHLRNCIAQAKEHLRELENRSEGVEKVQNRTGGGYSCEGHFTVDPEPPQPEWLMQSNLSTPVANLVPLHNGGGGSGDMLLQWGHRKRSRISRSVENRSAGAATGGNGLADDSSSSSSTQLQAMMKVPRRSITLPTPATTIAGLIETKNSSNSNIMPPPSSVLPDKISITASAPANSSTSNGKVGSHKSSSKDNSFFVNRRNLEDRSGGGSGSHPPRSSSSSKGVIAAASSSRSKLVKRSPQKVGEKIDQKKIGSNCATTVVCSSGSASLKIDEKVNGLVHQEQVVGFGMNHHQNNISSALPQEAGCSNTTATNHNHEDISSTKIIAGGVAIEAVNGGGEVHEWPRVHIPLTRKEKEEDFLLMKGTKLPHRPKKRPKAVDRMLQYCFPGTWLVDVTKTRYEVKEKKCTTKKPKRRGLKGMESMESDSE
ncbi:hypothetical protein POM88_034103 [Heracleum sosnowskyi]|uniref:Uncharacterized protein n=1 Tax=Heracleum sosnowskyi TaxID=360622 RepID=A0AAD8MBX5_9APIA|nr:hypothetical protein POM88_034103 [Heracleum sosnowskyi]